MHSQRFARRVVQRHEPLAAALALDGEHPVVGGEHAARERDQLRDAQAGGIERLERGVEAERAASRATLTRRLARLLGGVEQALDLGEGQDLRQGPAEPRAVDCRARIVVAHAFREQEAEELADGGELARARGRRETLAGEPGEEAAQLLGRGVGRVLALDGEVGEELREVARIGLDGMGGGAALGAQHVEKQRKLG